MPDDLVTIPRAVLTDLVAVAAYVSLGRHAVDHQPDGSPYPDAEARHALGALHDHLDATAGTDAR